MARLSEINVVAAGGRTRPAQALAAAGSHDNTARCPRVHGRGRDSDAKKADQNGQP